MDAFREPANTLALDFPDGSQGRHEPEKADILTQVALGEIIGDNIKIGQKRRKLPQQVNKTVSFLF